MKFCFSREFVGISSRIASEGETAGKDVRHARKVRFGGECIFRTLSDLLFRPDSDMREGSSEREK